MKLGPHYCKLLPVDCLPKKELAMSWLGSLGQHRPAIDAANDPKPFLSSGFALILAYFGTHFVNTV